MCYVVDRSTPGTEKNFFAGVAGVAAMPSWVWTLAFCSLAATSVWCAPVETEKSGSREKPASDNNCGNFCQNNNECKPSLQCSYCDLNLEQCRPGFPCGHTCVNDLDCNNAGNCTFCLPNTVGVKVCSPGCGQYCDTDGQCRRLGCDTCNNNTCTLWKCGGACKTDNDCETGGNCFFCDWNRPGSGVCTTSCGYPCVRDSQCPHRCPYCSNYTCSTWPDGADVQPPQP